MIKSNIVTLRSGTLKNFGGDMKAKEINEDVLKAFSVYIQQNIGLPLWFINIVLGRSKPIKGKKMNLASAKAGYNNSEAYTEKEFMYAKAIIENMKDFYELVSFFKSDSLNNKSLLLRPFVKRAIEIIMEDVVNKNILNSQFIELNELMEKVVVKQEDNKWSSLHWIRNEVYFSETREMLFDAWLKTANGGKKSGECLKKIFTNSPVYSKAHQKAREELIHFHTREINKIDKLYDLGQDHINIAVELESPELLKVIVKKACSKYKEDKNACLSDLKKFINLISPENQEDLKMILETVAAEKKAS